MTNTTTASTAEGRQQMEDAIYKDAWNISLGASNPVAVAHTLHQRSSEIMGLRRSTAAVRSHPALRVIAAHLAFLYGAGVGPNEEDYAQVTAVAMRLGLVGTPSSTATH